MLLSWTMFRVGALPVQTSVIVRRIPLHTVSIRPDASIVNVIAGR
jgi:hypothetical protein